RVPEKRKFPKKLEALPRIGIPNKGRWTELPLRYVVAGNPYISKQKITAVDQIDFGWKDEENEKSNNAHILRGTT
ncbi:3-methyladenine DNA glycosylase, partial [Enterococcus faecalis]